MFYFFSLSPKTDGGLINEQIVVKAKMRKKMQGFFQEMCQEDYNTIGFDRW